MPGYALNRFEDAARVIEAVNAPNLRLQFDAYHAHRITGDLADSWRRYAPLTAHVQIAGHPGRHEPNVGGIDYPSFYAQLDQSGYSGWVSAEYHPKTTTAEGLGWLN